MSGVPVVLASDPAFVEPTAVAITSLLTCQRDPSTIDVVVLDDGLSTTDRSTLTAATRRFSAHVEFIDASLPPFATATSQLPPSTYLRLLAPELVEAERILYLDGDVLVRTDLGPLLTSDLGGTPVGAVRDIAITTVSAPGGVPHWSRLGLDAETPYVNAGVLLIDVSTWRGGEIGERCLEDQRTERTPLADQGSLNAVLGGDVTLLDPTWNAQASLLWLDTVVDDSWKRELEARRDELLLDPAIAHFVGPHKPWTGTCRHPLAGEWRNVAARIGVDVSPPVETDDTLLHERERIADLLATHVAEGDTICFVDEDLWLPEQRGRHVVHPFPRENGVFRGCPSGDADAIDSLDAERREGAIHLAVPRTSRWWLDAYPKWAAALEREADVVVADPDLTIYHLSAKGAP